MTAAVAIPFRFNVLRHEYSIVPSGEIVPHITGMLSSTGLVDDTWFTEESSIRGTIVHALTAHYDMGALDLVTCDTRYMGYVQAHVAAMKVLRPEFLAIEEPFVHPLYRFGGRPDRVVIDQGRKAVLELKTAVPSKAHPIQTALQAILVEQFLGIPAEMVVRLCLYVKETGRYSLEEHACKRDLRQAREIIRSTTGRG